MKNYLKKYWPSLSIMIIFAVAAIVFLCINQDTLGLICLINTVIHSFDIMLDVRDEKEKEQNQLINALRRKVAALEELIRAVDVRERLDCECLRKQDDISTGTVEKAENRKSSS